MLHTSLMSFLLASRSDALIINPHRDLIPSNPSTYSSEAHMPIYMKDRKSFKNSDNAMEPELSFQKGHLQKKNKDKDKDKN